MPELSAPEVSKTIELAPKKEVSSNLEIDIIANAPIVKGAGGLANAMVAVSESKDLTGSKIISFGLDKNTVEKDHEIEGPQEIIGLMKKNGTIESYSVPATKQEYHAHYADIANNWLWPILHDMPENIHGEFSYDNWALHDRVNERFADTYAEYVKQKPSDNRVAWIHDYHLTLLAPKLREKGVDVPMGFFLHIPFPNREMFKSLPETIEKEGMPPRHPRQEVLQGLLANDVVGFQTKKDASNFLGCVDEEFGLTRDDISKTENGYVLNWQGRKVTIESYPISIDPSAIKETIATEETQSKLKELQEEFKDKTLIVDASRLDPTKGIIPQIDAYDGLLEILEKKDPELLDKMLFVRIVAPSRESVPAYARLKEEMDKKVAALNEKYEGRGRGKKIILAYESVPNSEVLALFELENTVVAFVATEADGMNLVAKEAASVGNKKLRVIVGKGAGAAPEFKGAALTPAVSRDEQAIKRLAGTLYGALTMRNETAEQWKNNLEDRVQANDVGKWGSNFLNTLLSYRKT